MEENEKNNEILDIDQSQEVRWYEKQLSLDDTRTFIKASMITAARSFIAIGFFLKCVRDRNLFLEDGYESVWEFAQDEYGISKSTASRYMTMNDRFSQNGNSPNVKAEYKAFGKSQLQEMLALTDEQLEQVKPTDRVEDIRGMRKPKEIPYIELPGQMELEKDFLQEDFNDIFPEEEFETIPSQPLQKQEFSTDITEFAELAEDVPEGAAEAQQTEEFIAISQQEPEKLSAYGTPIKVYPADSLIAMPGCEGGHDCFMCHLQCDIRQEYCRCVEAMTGNPFPCEQISRVDVLREEMGERCQFVNLELAYHRAGDHEPVPCCKECKEPCQYACERSVPERAPEPEPQPRAWNIYATQCIHRNGFSCTVPDDKKSVPGDGSNCNESCCWECTQHGECKLECNCSASRPEELESEPVQADSDPVIDAEYEEVPEPAEERKQIGELELSSRTENVLKRAGVDTVERLVSMSDEDLTAVRGMSKRSMEEIRTKLNDPDPADKTEPEESATDLQVVRQMLEKENKLLSSCLLAVSDQNDIHIRQMKLRVAALASFVCDLDDIENPAPKPEQPELPLLKNNDQRAAFIDAYETWPLWIETAETGERYYRYDLPDGTSMVVKVYHAMLFDHSLVGIPLAERYTESYGCHEYYLLMPGKFFRDCESNRSTLIDKLKEIQKKEKA